MASRLVIWLMCAVYAHRGIAARPSLSKGQRSVRGVAPAFQQDDISSLGSLRPADCSGESLRLGHGALANTSGTGRLEISSTGRPRMQTRSKVPEKQEGRQSGQNLGRSQVFDLIQDQRLNRQDLRARGLTKAESPKDAPRGKDRQERDEHSKNNQLSSKEAVEADSQRPKGAGKQRNRERNSSVLKLSKTSSRLQAQEDAGRTQKVPRKNEDHQAMSYHKRYRSALEEGALSDPGGSASVRLENLRRNERKRSRVYREKLKKKAMENPGGLESLQYQKELHRQRKKQRKMRQSQLGKVRQRNSGQSSRERTGQSTGDIQLRQKLTTGSKSGQPHPQPDTSARAPSNEETKLSRPVPISPVGAHESLELMASRFPELQSPRAPGSSREMQEVRIRPWHPVKHRPGSRDQVEAVSSDKSVRSKNQSIRSSSSTLHLAEETIDHWDEMVKPAKAEHGRWARKVLDWEAKTNDAYPGKLNSRHHPSGRPK